MTDPVKQATETFKQECQALAAHRVRVEQVAQAVNTFAAECESVAKGKDQNSSPKP